MAVTADEYSSISGEVMFILMNSSDWELERFSREMLECMFGFLVGLTETFIAKVAQDRNMTTTEILAEMAIRYQAAAWKEFP